MPLVNRIRIKIGDVVEVETPLGLAYVQYTHYHRDHPHYGELIRILPGYYSKRPTEFSEIVKKKERFWIFYPLGPSANRKLVTIVANEEIPEHARQFPIFRHGMRLPGNKFTPDDWNLWDGSTWTKIKKLLPEHYHLSLLSVCNHTFLVDRIASDYKPEDQI